MEKKLVFRFDIDTHKCIRDGVPNLLDISEKYDVPFTFFLNTGRSISIMDTLSGMFKKDNNEDNVKMMSAISKLGIGEYIYTAIINPKVSMYERHIKRLLCSTCEVGIHGGRNHAKWQRHAHEWTQERIENEINYAINIIKKIKNDYSLSGFASPAWNHPEILDSILKEKGFIYSADCHAIGINPINNKGELANVGVNLLGEPGGVAFFESCRVNNLSTEQIVEKVMESLDTWNIVVLYDHPYYAGVKEIECISKIIEAAKKQDVEICTVEKLI